MVHIFDIEMGVDCIRIQTQKKIFIWQVIRALREFAAFYLSRYIWLTAFNTGVLCIISLKSGVAMTTPSIAKGGVCKQQH